MTDNDFASALPGDPTTTRLTLRFGGVNQHSQVGWPGYDPEMKLDPVFLPMELINAPAGSQSVAPPDTVAIVRWLETENEIWFQVNHSSMSWIRNPQGELVRPSVENGFVRFSIGFSPQVVVNLGSEPAEVTYHAFELGEEVAVTHREIPSGRSRLYLQ